MKRPAFLAFAMAPMALGMAAGTGVCTEALAQADKPFMVSYQPGMYAKGPAPSTNDVVCSVEMVPMRDGVKLSTEVYRPGKPGKYPVIMQRTAYYDSAGVSGCVETTKPGTMPVEGPTSRKAIAARGYVVIIQESRGTSRSEGEFKPAIEESRDGYDAIEWAARQAWSNGRVGMTGGSYHGMTQWQAAIAKPPHLVTIVPWMGPLNLNEGWPLGPTGTFEQGTAQQWAGSQSLGQLRRRLVAEGATPERIAAELTARAKEVSQAAFRRPADVLPLANDRIFNNDLTPFYREWIEHPNSLSDPYWKDVIVEDKFPSLSIPVLVLGGWYDKFIRASIGGYEGMQNKSAPQARKNARLVIAGAGHALVLGHDIDQESLGNYVGDITFGKENQIPEDLTIRWLDHWLKGIENGVMDEAAVKLFVMIPPDQGSVGTGFWVTGSEFPLKGTKTVRYYLGGGKANSIAGGGTLSTTPGDGSDQYRYDPAYPVPSIGGTTCCGGYPGGPFDQRPAEMRPDVLVYTSATLGQPLPVIGEISVTLKASSSAPSTAFTAKLIDVHQDDYAQIISEGIVVTSAASPNEAASYTIPMSPTATVFKPGHRIRLEISSSSYPRYTPHTNTTAPIATARDLVVATQNIMWAGTSLNLPVAPVSIPRNALNPALAANLLQQAPEP